MMRTAVRQIVLLLVLLFGAQPAIAQEGATSPPPALEFPFQASASTQRGISLGLVRAAVERAADTELCLILMHRDGKVGPPDAQGRETCLPNYAAKVRANEGFVQWAPGARPITCTNCFGRPFMSQQNRLNRPNLRRATVFGRLAFLSTTGPNRTITYGYRAHFTCAAENGARQGRMRVELEFDPPVIGDPGFWESLVDFFAAGQLTGFIDSRIRQELGRIPGLRLDQDACRSVGVDLGDKPIFDMVRFDLPAPTRPTVSPILADRVTIRLTRLTRNPLPPLVPAEHARPGAAEVAQFTLFANGAISSLPAAGLALPPEGGTIALNHCKTIDVGGAQRLQIIFANELGGAAWSEFTRAGGFGVGPHSITTGRTVVVPGLPGPPDPVTGKPRPVKPTPVPLREFELRYEISRTRPQLSTAETAARTTQRAGTQPKAAATPAGATLKAAPCTAI